ncbi:unnamed protein product [Soboliphyme baturini]|uniref:Rab-GAP TBC domain-containing protein n=1 Tax=Soboliphyme baturini TaxID=241478 RepID=A0A183IMD6_9BILA|nr:unnamed protein product [Soboliphyme baturini]
MGMCGTVKIEKIKSLLQDADPDREALKQLALSTGGFVSDAFRQTIWPLILDADEDEDSSEPELDPQMIEGCASISEETVSRHPEYHQVLVDVNRTLARFPPNITDDKRHQLQDELTPLIVRILVRNPNFRYYQGFHDVCLTVLLAVGERWAFRVCSRLATTYFRPFLEKPLDQSTRVLNYVYSLIAVTDPELYSYLTHAEVGTMFALSWLLTWFSHVIRDYDTLVRLFDLFIVCHHLMPVYLTASIVLYRFDEITRSHCDMATIHSLLSKLPVDLPYEALVQDAVNLYAQYPPSTLKTIRADEQVNVARKVVTRTWPVVTCFTVAVFAWYLYKVFSYGHVP